MIQKIRQKKNFLSKGSVNSFSLLTIISHVMLYSVNHVFRDIQASVFLKYSHHSLTVGGAPRQNCGQLNLSGSSSSLASEGGVRAAGGRSYGIGGAFLQRQILRMTCQSGRQEENRQGQEETRKRFRSPFRLLRDRSKSRDRTDEQQADSLKTDRHRRRETV